MVNKENGWLQAIKALGNALLPPSCLLCGCRCKGSLCQACHRELPWLEHCCQQGSLPLPAHSGLICGQCQQHAPYFRSCLCLWQYQYPIDRLVLQFKYQQAQGPSRFLGGQLANSLGQHMSNHKNKEPMYIVPVPSHWYRRLQRGTQQAAVLAHYLSRQSGIPTIAALSKNHHSPSQQGLSRTQRLLNLQSTFKVAGNAASKAIAGSGIILVDDVMTTGTTANLLSKLLMDTGAAWVDVACLARTPSPPD